MPWNLGSQALEALEQQPDVQYYHLPIVTVSHRGLKKVHYVRCGECELKCGPYDQLEAHAVCDALSETSSCSANL